MFDFCDGGADDEITRRGNEAAFADWAFLPVRPVEAAGALVLMSGSARYGSCGSRHGGLQ